jgi:hypothetical protein
MQKLRHAAAAGASCGAYDKAELVTVSSCGVTLRRLLVRHVVGKRSCYLCAGMVIRSAHQCFCAVSAAVVDFGHIVH